MTNRPLLVSYLTSRPAYHGAVLRKSVSQLANSQYRYERLASPTSFRLLELHPGDAGSVRCSLKTFDQVDTPSFHAFSYTWGFPLGPLSKTREDSRFNGLVPLTPSTTSTVLATALERRPDASAEHAHESNARICPITCDGRTILITPNLHDALQRFAAPGIETKSGARPLKHKYIWVDALCVDQDNIPERNSQVAIMADIFRAADSVVMWLGAEDQFTADAFTLISRISSIPSTAWDSISYTDFFDPSWAQAVGIEPVSHFHWLGFLALISRPWFRRAWVVQEVAFAPKAVVVCGDKTIPWRKLDVTLQFLRSRRWYHHLATDKLRHLAALREDPGIYGEFLKTKSSLGVGPINLSTTRRFISKHKFAHSLTFLMNVHRATEATDPRDKVYAFLGLVGKKASSSILSPARENLHEIHVEPDYTQSVQQIYTTVTRSLLLSDGHLDLLSHVQDASQTQLEGLPSWVADYTVALHPYPLSFRGNSNFNACGDLKWRPDEALMRRGLLPVQGYQIGTIEETAATPDETKDSAAYWANIVRLARQLPDFYPRPSSDKPQTRVEALWRTLMTDTYSRKHPAPEDCGRLFIDYILNLQIRHTLAPWSRVDFHPHQEHHHAGGPGGGGPRDAARLPAWQDLLEAEPAGSPCGAALYRERMAAVMESVFRGAYSPLQLSQLQHELDVASGSMRRVFRTATTTGGGGGGGGGVLLGTGARSLARGDEVWVLAGAKVPLVLRAAAEGGGGGGRRRLVGEAYVHGVMHCREEARKEKGELRDIILT